jgi:1,4-dihydroxy-2-naphthoate octaprenyltransferase
MSQPNTKDWISAMRLRTLPLALSCALMGSFLAWFFDVFHWEVLLFTLLTTLSLQILSNLANDYGDSIHGADSADRKGPSRAVQSGRISKSQMKNAVIVFSSLSVVFGIILVWIAPIDLMAKVILFGFGILAILAAINYTIGKQPYGYKGYGDFSVFIFFGLLAVIGTYYLHSNAFRWDLLLPAAATGTLAVAVLNVNNIRDMESDIKAGKRSLAVKLGRKNAVIYHIVLLVAAIALTTAFVLLNYKGRSQFIWVLAIPMFVRNAREVAKQTEASELDPYLKQMALSTLIFTLLFGFGHLI